MRLPNLVLAYHGCDATTASAVASHKQQLHPSNNEYDWLGHGIYFWEYNLQRALSFAHEQSDRMKKAITTPAVLGAIIDLGNCLDLLDERHLVLVRKSYEIFRDAVSAQGLELPVTGARPAPQTICSFAILTAQ